jgi:TP901 family phage tail tape measure protein
MARTINIDINTTADLAALTSLLRGINTVKRSLTGFANSKTGNYFKDIADSANNLAKAMDRLAAAQEKQQASAKKSATSASKQGKEINETAQNYRELSRSLGNLNGFLRQSQNMMVAQGQQVRKVDQQFDALERSIRELGEAEAELNRLRRTGRATDDQRTLAMTRFSEAAARARAALTNLNQSQRSIINFDDNMSRQLTDFMTKIRQMQDMKDLDLIPEGQAARFESELRQMQFAARELQQKARDAGTTLQQLDSAIGMSNDVVRRATAGKQEYTNQIRQNTEAARASTAAWRTFGQSITSVLAPIKNFVNALRQIASNLTQGVRNALNSITRSISTFGSTAGSAFAKLRSTMSMAGGWFSTFAQRVQQSMNASRQAVTTFYNAGWSLLTSGYMAQSFGTGIFRGLSDNLNQYMDYERQLMKATIAAGSFEGTGEQGTLTIDPKIVQEMIFGMQRGTLGAAPLRSFDAAQLAEGLYYYASAIGQPITEQNMGQLAPIIGNIMSLSQVSGAGLETTVKAVLNTALEFGFDPRATGDAEQMGALGNIAAQIGWLSNISTMEVPDIAEMFKQVGPMANLLVGGQGGGLNDTMLLAFLASEMGLRGSRVGTGLNQAFMTLLDPTDKNLETASRFFGIEASQEAWDAFFKDSEGRLEGGIPGLFEKIGQIPKEQQAQFLAELFTTNATRNVLAMQAALEKNGGWDAIMEETRLATGDPQRWLSQAMAATNDTVFASMQNMKNAWFAIQTEIIDGISGPFKGALNGIAEIFWEIADVVRANPWIAELVASITTAIAAVSSFIGVLFVMSGSVLLVLKAFQMLGGSLGPAVFFLLSAVKAAVLLVPLLAALAAVGTMLYIAWQNNFLGIRDFVDGMRQTLDVGELMQSMMDRIYEGAQLLGTAWMQFVSVFLLGIDGPINALGSLLTTLFGPQLANYFLSTLTNWSNGLNNFRENFVDFVTDLRNGAGALTGIADTIQGFLEVLFLGGISQENLGGMRNLGALLGIENFPLQIHRAATALNGFLDSAAGYFVGFRDIIAGIFNQIGNNLTRIFRGLTSSVGLGAIRDALTGFAMGFGSAILTAVRAVELLTRALANLGRAGRWMSDLLERVTGISVGVGTLATAVGVLLGAFAGGRLLAAILPFETLLGVLMRIGPIISIVVSVVGTLLTSVGLLAAPILAVAAALLIWENRANGIEGVMAGLQGILDGFIVGLFAIGQAVYSAVEPLVQWVAGLLQSLDSMTAFNAVGFALAAVFAMLAGGAILGVVASLAQFTVGLITAAATITGAVLGAIASLTASFIKLSFSLTKDVLTAIGAFGSAMATTTAGVAANGAVMSTGLMAIFTNPIAAIAALIAALFTLVTAVSLVAFTMTGGWGAVLQTMGEFMDMAAPIMMNIMEIWQHDASTGMAMLGATLAVGLAGAIATMIAQGPKMLGWLGGGALDLLGGLLPEDSALGLLLGKGADATRFLGNMSTMGFQAEVRDIQAGFLGKIYTSTQGMVDSYGEMDTEGGIGGWADRLVAGFTDRISNTRFGNLWNQVLEAMGMDPNNPKFGDVDWKNLLGFAQLDDLMNSEAFQYMPKELQGWMEIVDDWQQWQETVARFGGNVNMARGFYEANNMTVPKPPNYEEYWASISEQMDEGAAEAEAAAQRAAEVLQQMNEALMGADLGTFLQTSFMPEGGGKSAMSFIYENAEAIISNIGDAGPWLNPVELLADVAGAGGGNVNVLGKNVHEALRPALEIVAQQTGVSIDEMLKDIPKFYAPEEFVNVATDDLLEGIATLPKELYQKVDTLGAGDWTEFGLDWQELTDYAIGQAITGTEWNLADYVMEAFGVSEDEAIRRLKAAGLSDADIDAIGSSWFGDTTLWAQSLQGQVNVINETWWPIVQGMTDDMKDTTIEISEGAFAALPDSVKTSLSALGYTFVIGGQQTANQVAAGLGAIQTAILANHPEIPPDIMSGIMTSLMSGEVDFRTWTDEAGTSWTTFVDNINGTEITIPTADAQPLISAVNESKTAVDGLVGSLNTLKNWKYDPGLFGGQYAPSQQEMATTPDPGGTGGPAVGAEYVGATPEMVRQFLASLGIPTPEEIDTAVAEVSTAIETSVTEINLDSIELSGFEDFGKSVAEAIGKGLSDNLGTAISAALSGQTTGDGTGGPETDTGLFSNYGKQSAEQFRIAFTENINGETSLFNPFGEGAAVGNPWETFGNYGTDAAEAFRTAFQTGLEGLASGLGLLDFASQGTTWGIAAGNAFAAAFRSSMSIGAGGGAPIGADGNPAPYAPGGGMGFTDGSMGGGGMAPQTITVAVKMDFTDYDAGLASLNQNLIDNADANLTVDAKMDDTEFIRVFNAVNGYITTLGNRKAVPAVLLQAYAFDMTYNAVNGKLDTLTQRIATPTVNLNDNASGPLGTIIDRLNSIDGRVVTSTANVNTNNTTTNTVRTVTEGIGPTQQLATGGYVNSAIQLVGEQGPELVALPQGSYVYNATATANMMDSLASPVGVAMDAGFSANAPRSFSNGISNIDAAEMKRWLIDAAQGKQEIHYNINVDAINISKEVDIDRALERFDRLTGNRTELLRRGMGTFEEHRTM